MPSTLRRDDHQREAERPGEIGDVQIVSQRRHQPADALDHDHLRAGPPAVDAVDELPAIELGVLRRGPQDAEPAEPRTAGGRPHRACPAGRRPPTRPRRRPTPDSPRRDGSRWPRVCRRPGGAPPRNPAAIKSGHVGLAHAGVGSGHKQAGWIWARLHVKKSQPIGQLPGRGPQHQRLVEIDRGQQQVSPGDAVAVAAEASPEVAAALAEKAVEALRGPALGRLAVDGQARRSPGVGASEAASTSPTQRPAPSCRNNSSVSSPPG